MRIRVILATVLIAGGVVVAPVAAIPAHADPETCSPVCDRIPDSAWIHRRDMPLSSVYHWPSLASVAVPVTGTTPRFRFEELCATPAVPQDPRSYAIAARAAVVSPDGQWQLQAQVLHWRGDTARRPARRVGVRYRGHRAARLPAGVTAAVVVDHHRRTEPPGRVISGPVILHTYLIAHPASSTISELALWSSTPPQVPRPVIADAQVLGALTAPLCTAYISSCP